MGGRGASSYRVIRRLKNFRNAVIPRNKLKNYILNPSKDKNKAEFFASLGYNMKNYKRLINDVKSKLKTNKALKYKEKDKNGNEAYQVNMLLGVTKKRMVTTAWIIKPGEKSPQFITAYQNKKLRPGDA